jgi:serine/threonine-protein kinase RsbW
VTEAEPAAEQSGVQDLVELTVPADPAYISVLRTVTASLAARRDFTIEEIDDLRIAVDEASALLLPHAGSDSHLGAVFGGPSDSITVTVTVSATGDDETRRLDQTSFAWLVLAALADTVTSDLAGSILSVTLTKVRGARAR